MKLDDYVNWRFVINAIWLSQMDVATREACFEDKEGWHNSAQELWRKMAGQYPEEWMRGLRPFLGLKYPPVRRRKATREP